MNRAPKLFASMLVMLALTASLAVVGTGNVSAQITDQLIFNNFDTVTRSHSGVATYCATLNTAIGAAYGYTGKGLHLDYSIMSEGWACYWMFFNSNETGVNLSGYTDIRLMVRKGTPMPLVDPMKVELADTQFDPGNLSTYNHKHAVYLYMCDGFEDGPQTYWQEAVIPLSTFTRSSDLNLGSIKQVNIVFDLPPGWTGSGEGIVDVDYIRFTDITTPDPTPEGIIVDDFNDGAPPNNLGAGCGTTSGDDAADPGTSYVQDSHEGLGALKIDYDRDADWAGYWSFLGPDGNPDPTVYDVLPGDGLDVNGLGAFQMAVKGAAGNEVFKVEIADTLYDPNDPSTHSHKGEWYIGVPSAGYTEVAVPLGASAFNGVNMGDLQQVNIVFDNAPNASTIYVDLMRFTAYQPPLPPTADFTYSPSNPTTSDLVYFTDQSSAPSGYIVSWSWDFDDGSTSTLQNPTHQYSSPNSYCVTLTVTDNNGLTSGPAWEWIEVTGGPTNQPPVADFTYSPGSPTTDDTVYFTDQSTDPDGSVVSWSWNFGDGSTSTSQNPTHQYSVANTYTVTLTVEDDDGATDTESKQITVHSGDVTLVSISPSTQEVSSDENFVVDIYVQPTEAIIGVNFDLSFDPSLVSVTGVEQGSVLDQFDNVFFISGDINNDIGIVKDAGFMILGDSTSESGAFIRINFTATDEQPDDEVETTSLLDLDNVEVWGADANLISSVTNDGSVTVIFYYPWDVDCDGQIGWGDVAQISVHWGETGDPGWIRADINNDGVVSWGDVAQISVHWGEVY